MSLISLNAELRQMLKLTPQLLQSMELLQMNMQELAEYLSQATEENPLLEQEDAADLHAAYEELRQKASWIDGAAAPTFAHEEHPTWERGQLDREAESLAAFLRDQLERLRLPAPLLALCQYMAELVDEDGYLLPADLDGLQELKIPQALIRQALDIMQGLEPAGVCARSLSECLALQLARQENVSPAALDIVSRFLPELGDKRYNRICQELGLSMKEVLTAKEQIASLDPHPGRVFQAAEPPVFVRPDIFVLELDGELRAVLNEYYLPRISINSYYAQLLKESDERETRNYLQQKMQQAKWLLHSLSRRGATLQRCADAILDAQRPFFLGQTQELAPMGLAALSSRLGVHPSTVSRAMRGKYLQCRQGTYPLRYFFSRAIGGLSRQAVKQKLLLLLRDEDPQHPLSDQQLCDLLSVDGMQIARRTIAKYRAELGVGPSSARRQ